MSSTDKNVKILVTGASGYLGSNILRHLHTAGYQNLTGLSRSLPDADEFDFRLNHIPVDILDVLGLEDAFAGHDIVVHAAGLVSYQPADKQKLFKTNVIGTANVVNCALTSGISQLIHISSTAALGIPPEPQVLDEKYMPDPTQFLTDYALSKWYGELEVWRGMKEGLHASVISPSAIIGSSTKQKNTDVFIHKIKNGLHKYPSGSAGFVHHHDVCQAVLLTIQSFSNEKKYILSAENLSWKEFLQAVAFRLHSSGKLNPASNLEVKLLGIKNTFKRLIGLNTGTPTGMAKQMMQVLEYNGSLITSEFDFTYTPIQQALDDYCKNFR